MARHCRPFLCLAASMAALGCGSEAEVPDSAAASPVVRDSAGIRIVENAGPAWEDGEGWTVASEPDLVIAELAGVPIYQVGSIDIDGDGRMLVTHQSEQQLVLLDADGALVRTIGRRGQGPGEFSALSKASWMGEDSLVATDGAGRVSVFPTADDGGRTAAIPTGLSDEAALSPVGALEDGRLILEGWIKEGAERTDAMFGQIVATSPALDRPTPLVTMPFALCFPAPGKGEGCGLRTFGPFVTHDVGDDVVASGFGTDYQVRVDAPPPDGRSEIWRLQTEAVEVTGAMWDAYLSAAGGDAASILDDVARTQGRPERLPHFQALVIAESGRVWVQEEERLDSKIFTPAERLRDQRSWGVFDSTGTFLGRVRTPASFDLHVVAADYVLGVHRDEFEVETIRRYGLDRGGG